MAFEVEGEFVGGLALELDVGFFQQEISQGFAFGTGDDTGWSSFFLSGKDITIQIVGTNGIKRVCTNGEFR